MAERYGAAQGYQIVRLIGRGSFGTPERTDVALDVHGELRDVPLLCYYRVVKMVI